ncbi:MAG: sugar phosphate isomerase/epimerase family protein, partial [Verrucomicrobiota bacterium]
ILDWLLEDKRDLEIQDACLPGFLDSEWAPVADQINSLLSGYNGRLGIHGSYYGIQIASSDSLVREIAQKRLDQSLDFAHAISAKQCVIHSPFIFFGSGHACHTHRTDLEASLAKIVETLTPIVERAADLDIVLVMENIFDKSPTPLRALISRFDSPHLRRSIDTGHAAITERTGAGPSPEYWVQEASDILHHVHLQDTNGEYDYHWTIGEGSINWEGVFKKLSQVDTDPHLVIETADPISGWQYLKSKGLAK